MALFRLVSIAISIINANWPIQIHIVMMANAVTVLIKMKSHQRVVPKILDARPKHSNVVQVAIALVGISYVMVDPIVAMPPMKNAHYQKHEMVPRVRPNRLNAKRVAFAFQKLHFAMENDNVRMVKMN